MRFEHEANSLSSAKNGFHDCAALPSLASTIRGTYYVVAQAKVYCPAEPIFLFKIGTDGLEISSLWRESWLTQENFDIKELGDRLGAAVSVEEIYSRYPDHKENCRRLNDTLNHHNPPNWLDGGKKKDAPRNFDTRDVNVADCWMKGRSDCVAILKHHVDFSNLDVSMFLDLEEKGITMFKPIR